MTFLSLAILAPLLFAKGTDWKVLLTVVGTLLSFVYFIQKQQLDEAKFSNELFIRFNQRYDELNERLNHIKNKNVSEMLESHEFDTLNDYFNLCGEEYLFYRRGYVYPEVWKSWVAGMKIFYDDERIQNIWSKELNTESYYSLNVNKEIKKLPKQKTALENKA
jgi:predicted nucleic acid-binding protein